jgi:hypothetical protein
MAAICSENQNPRFALKPFTDFGVEEEAVDHLGGDEAGDREDHKSRKVRTQRGSLRRRTIAICFRPKAWLKVARWRRMPAIGGGAGGGGYRCRI